MDQQASRFTPGTSAADGTPLTTFDSTTGLEWTVRPVGGEQMRHQQATDACAALDIGGHGDWRLPTRAELLSLVDLTRYEPCIDTDAFPDFPTEDRWFWTSDLCAWSSASAWLVDFGYGGLYSNHRDHGGFALAVRRAGQ